MDITQKPPCSLASAGESFRATIYRVFHSVHVSSGARLLNLLAFTKSHPQDPRLPPEFLEGTVSPCPMRVTKTQQYRFSTAAEVDAVDVGKVTGCYNLNRVYLEGVEP